MASDPVTSRQIEGKKWKLTDFIFLGSQIPAGGDCSHEIKRLLLLGRKVIINPRLHIKKQRHYLANRSLSSQSYGFPVVMYGWESWTIKKEG